jgi:hypothetical protein
MGDAKGGRYGALIKQAKQAPPDDQNARQPKNQVHGEPDNQMPGQTDNQIDRKPDNQMPGQPDNQIDRKPDNQMTGQPDNQIGRKPAPDEKQVNLCVKVPESLRRHWAIQAKIQGVTMTAVMVEALTQKFGLPDDQMTR